MARYQQTFNLDPVDIDLIEHAIRGAIARRSGTGMAGVIDASGRAEIDALNRVLGKIHNQKIFYRPKKADAPYVGG